MHSLVTVFLTVGTEHNLLFADGTSSGSVFGGVGEDSPGRPAC